VVRIAEFPLARLTKMTPEQEALYALNWELPRSDLSMAAQLE